MARTLSTALLAAQTATKRKPAIRININSVDYSSRLLLLEHHEEPHRDYATIVLSNSDRGLDAVSTATSNLLGYRFRIAYGYYTGETVAEPNGDGAGKEYVESADLWVKSQQLISSPGQLVCQLYCEGQWMSLREQRVMALLNEMAVANPDEVGNDPYFSATFEGTHTVYQLIESILENAMSWTLNASPATDDDILNDFKPFFSLEELPFAADILRGLISMTKCYLRAKANLAWDIVYPQTTDAVNETYYSDQPHYFLEYAEALNLMNPNRIVVFCNNPLNKDEWPEPVMIGDTGVPSGALNVGSGNYNEVLEAQLARTITQQLDADRRVAAILSRYKAEVLAGYLIVPHDARVELYDRAAVVDTRGL